ncbi:putative short-chain dehydrogenase [Xylogone sp. PMI_703]|nr:putative short-chain dehydrogenase [Xylogone sp. PMI_703]
MSCSNLDLIIVVIVILVSLLILLLPDACANMETGLNVWDQLFTKLPVPTSNWSGQTVIITGSNGGLGLETARHIVRLGAERLIMAARSVPKGEEARKSILTSNPSTSCTIEVWPLDLASYASVISFAERAERELTRLDCVIQNAGMAKMSFEMTEKDETNITVNVISTMLLTLLLLPKVKQTAKNENLEMKPRITIVSSASHVTTTIPTSNILPTLNDPKKSNMLMRYGATKLMQLFLAKSLSDRVKADGIIVNSMDPGAAKTNILDNLTFGVGYVFAIAEQKLLGRPAEHAARGLVWAAASGDENQGQYLAHCKIYKTSRFVRSKKGEEAQKNLWTEVMARLEEIKPGVTAGIADEKAV